MPTNLYDQLSPMMRKTLGSLLGFILDDQDKRSSVFRNRLRDIPALPKGFTMGDAVIAYCKAMIERYSD